MRGAISSEECERELIRRFLKETPRFFVKVDANHPIQGLQSWCLEQRGWCGIPVEPLPKLSEKLRDSRIAKIFAVASSSPKNARQLLPFHVAGPLSSLDRDAMARGAPVAQRDEAAQ